MRILENEDNEYYMATEENEETMFASEEFSNTNNRSINGIVVGGSLNLRAEPNKNSKILEILPEGSIVTTENLIIGSEWTAVETVNMERGYVMSKFIKWDEE